MTADTLKTTRVLELYQDFLSGKLINKQQAAEQYHVNVRSIQRDIDSIRDFLSEQCAKEGIVRKIEYDKKENGYRLVTQEIEQLSKGEVLALCKILLESRAFTKEQVEKQLQIILNLCVSQKEKSDIEWFISNELFHYHDPAHATVDPDNLWMVAQAIRNQSVLEIEYQKLKDRQIVKRMVEPVGLMFSEYYFYLMAVITDHSTREAFHKKNDPYPTIYRLDRIHSIKETGEKFSVPYKDRFKEGEYSLSGESLNECTKYCTSVLTVDEITRRIKSKGIKNKKEDIQQFASQLQDEMQSKCSDLLKERSEQLSVKVKEYVSDYQEGVQASFQEANLNADFDAGYAFASSLAKIGIIGGLGAFLAADAAFAFGSWAFLFGIGGQIALFANFLGPIGIVAGALISAGLGIMKLFGGGWEKSVAKKLVNAYEEKGVTDQYRKAINEYWAQTETAFDQAAEQLDQAWTAYVERLQTTVDSYDIEQIETSLTAAKGIQNFFEHIPL